MSGTSDLAGVLAFSFASIILRGVLGDSGANVLTLNLAVRNAKR